jgi:hypothetical protein
MPILILLFFVLFSTPSFSQGVQESSDQVWTVGDRRWSVGEEIRYGKWVEENITADFFIRH